MGGQSSLLFFSLRRLMGENDRKALGERERGEEKRREDLRGRRQKTSSPTSSPSLTRFLALMLTTEEGR